VIRRSSSAIAIGRPKASSQMAAQPRWPPPIANDPQRDAVARAERQQRRPAGRIFRTHPGVDHHVIDAQPLDMLRRRRLQEALRHQLALQRERILVARIRKCVERVAREHRVERTEDHDEPERERRRFGDAALRRTHATRG